MGVMGSKSKIEEQRFVESTRRTDGQKWLDSIERQKRRINLKFVRVTNRRMDRRTDRVNVKK